MTFLNHDHLLKVADLLESPGASRPVELDLPAPDSFDPPLVDLTGPLHLSGVLESVVEGLLVRGTLTVQLAVSCARCLEPVGDQVSAGVVELFHDPTRTDPADLEDADEGYEISDGRIGLDALLRDNLAPALPARPLCREDCKGLCVDCGTNLNEASCDCHDDRLDPRWAALRGLRLPGPGDDTRPDQA